MSFFLFFFFFQAEDGIRDHCVTGVQTCALPISWPDSMRPSFTHRLRMRSRRRSTASAVGSSALVATIYLLCAVASSGSVSLPPSQARALLQRSAKPPLPPATVGKAADAATLGRSGSGSDRVDEAAVLAVAFRASLEHEVLEVGERLALGHDAPVLLREQLV